MDDDDQEEEYMTEDKPKPVANNDNKHNMNLNREDTIIKRYPLSNYRSG